MRKVYLIVLIVLVLIVSGCNSVEGPTLAPAPTVVIEATVMSLHLDELYEEGELNPRDRASIRIDKIDRSNDPNNVFMFNVGEERMVYFLYSARPAKLIADISPSCREGWVLKSGSCVSEGCEGAECTVSSPQYSEKPAEMKDGYIIYHLPNRGAVTETILPGLQEGNRIKINVGPGDIRGRSPNFYIEVETYEVVS
jgi:hypothetical protein